MRKPFYTMDENRGAVSSMDYLSEAKGKLLYQSPGDECPEITFQNYFITAENIPW